MIWTSYALTTWSFWARLSRKWRTTGGLFVCTYEKDVNPIRWGACNNSHHHACRLGVSMVLLVTYSVTALAVLKIDILVQLPEATSVCSLEMIQTTNKKGIFHSKLATKVYDSLLCECIWFPALWMSELHDTHTHNLISRKDNN